MSQMGKEYNGVNSHKMKIVLVIVSYKVFFLNQLLNYY